MVTYRKRRLKNQKEDYFDDDMLDTSGPIEDDNFDDKSMNDLLDDDEFNEDLTLNDDGMNDLESVTPMEKHADLLKGMTNFDNYLKRLYFNWLGYSWSQEEKKFMPNPTLQPIMNKIGSNWFKSFVEVYVRDNNVLAHLDKDERDNLLEDINQTLFLTINKRKDEFGIKHNSDCVRIWNEVENASILALSGAGGGKYSMFLGGKDGGILSYNQTSTPMNNNPYQEQPKRKGLFSFLGFGGK